MKLNEDLIACQVCSEIFEDPVTCLNCNNNFCLKCVENIKNTSIKNKTPFNCPLCRKELKYQKNAQLKMLLDNMQFICSKCNEKIIGAQNYKKHNCKIYQCKICGLTLNNLEKFYEHINKNDIHIKIISFFFNKTSVNNDSWKTKFGNEIKLLEKENESEKNYQNFLIEDSKLDKKKEEEKNYLKQNNQQIMGYKNSKEIHEFQNFLNIKTEKNFDKIFKEYYLGNENFENFKKSNLFLSVCEKEKQNNSNNKNKIINIPKICKFSEKYNLYYCYKESNTNCVCCPNHICQPGNCMCKECMRVNLYYHGLKRYYLINKAGRACKYSHGNFYCHCRTETKTESENGNVFIGINWCHFPSLPCEACKEAMNLMDFYIEPEIVAKLKETYI